MTAASLDAALALVGYYGGRGADVDLAALPAEDLERAALQLGLLVRDFLGKTAEEREAELAGLSLHLQMSDLEHPEVVDVALSLLALLSASTDEGYGGASQILQTAPPRVVPLLARRLAWLAHGLLGDDDREREEALGRLSLRLQLMAMEVVCTGSLIVHEDGVSECFGAVDSDCPGAAVAHARTRQCHEQAAGCGRCQP